MASGTADVGHLCRNRVSRVTIHWTLVTLFRRVDATSPRGTHEHLPWCAQRAGRPCTLRLSIRLMRLHMGGYGLEDDGLGNCRDGRGDHVAWRCNDNRVANESQAETL